MLVTITVMMMIIMADTVKCLNDRDITADSNENIIPRRKFL